MRRRNRRSIERNNMAGLVFYLVFAIFWTVMTFSITTQFAVVDGGIFPIFAILFPVIGIVVIIAIVRQMMVLGIKKRNDEFTNNQQDNENYSNYSDYREVSERKCPHCGISVKNNYDYCPKCGNVVVR